MWLRDGVVVMMVVMVMVMVVLWPRGLERRSVMRQ